MIRGTTKQQESRHQGAENLQKRLFFWTVHSSGQTGQYLVPRLRCSPHSVATPGERECQSFRAAPKMKRESPMATPTPQDMNVALGDARFFFGLLEPIVRGSQQKQDMETVRRYFGAYLSN